MMPKVYDVLLVDDSPSDADLVLEALESHKSKCTIYRVCDGEQAMEFLHQQGKYQESPTPDLIFLDLNLPRKDGREVLREIKANAKLRMIPVVIMTTSSAEKDILGAYANHANSYFVKPLSIDLFLNAMKTLGDYWFSVVRLAGTSSTR